MIPADLRTECDSGKRVPVQAGCDGNYFALTAGLNRRPFPNIIFRPEIRWDHSNVAGPPASTRRMFNDFTDTDQLTLAADVIIQMCREMFLACHPPTTHRPRRSWPRAGRHRSRLVAALHPSNQPHDSVC